jgi:hypothetical protein
MYCCRVLIEGVKYYSREPKMLGKAFLRLVSNKELNKWNNINRNRDSGKG